VLTCQHCHGGAADFTFANMTEAHDGMFTDPSAFGQSGCTACHEESFARSSCDQCHETAVTNTMTSLHTTQRGYITAIEDRCGCDFDAANSADYQARCAGCHTTCGQCHVSRPKSVGGGFPKVSSSYSHRFRGTPNMSEQCMACHGSRIGHDFRGEGEGNVQDYHASRGMKCEDCHSKEEIHGDGTEYNHRYEVALMPRCEDCHGESGSVADVVTVDPDDFACSLCHINGVGSDPVEVPSMLVNHAHHVEVGDTDCAHCHRDGVPATEPPNMQCQTCHSQPYKNCTNCHNLQTEGDHAYEIDPSVLDIKIGYIPAGHPRFSDYDVALLRHTPVSEETYSNWGLDLTDYDSKPTWQYTSPHNIIASTPQTTVLEGESCALSCHGTAAASSDYLLRETDLYEEGGAQLPDYDANIGIVIPESFPEGK